MPSITLTIPDAKYAEYKKYFLLSYPNQTKEANDPNPMTDDQWIRYRIFLFVKNAYIKAKQQEFEQQNKPIIDEGIVVL